MEIKVNNGYKVLVELNETEQIIVAKIISNRLNLLAVHKITAADFITMLNWYVYQKEIGNENLRF